MQKTGDSTQWWIMTAMLGAVTSLGGAGASHILGRIDDLEDQQFKIPGVVREYIREHEVRPHRDAAHRREIDGVTARLERLDAKVVSSFDRLEKKIDAWKRQADSGR